MNLRVLTMAGLAFGVMTVTTLTIGPGIGVEANCVSLQTCGKTVTLVFKDAVQAVRLVVPVAVSAIFSHGPRWG